MTWMRSEDEGEAEVMGRRTSLPDESFSFTVLGVSHFWRMGFPVISILSSVIFPLVILARGRYAPLTGYDAPVWIVAIPVPSIAFDDPSSMTV